MKPLCGTPKEGALTLYIGQQIGVFEAFTVVNLITFLVLRRKFPGQLFFQGGLASTDEMCLIFLMYYPKISLATCQSSPPFTQLTKFMRDVRTR